jgi:hypothetical protein
VVFIRGRSLGRSHDVLLVSAVAVLTLFATYHRFYDAAVLSIVLAWAIGARVRESELRRHATVGLVCCAVFFVPGAWMLQRLVNNGTISTQWSHSLIWNDFLIRHQNWALVVLFISLAFAIERARQLHDRTIS